MDTVYGEKKSSKDCLLVLTERQHRKEIIEKIPDRTSDSVVKALDKIERRYGKLFPKIFRSITVDNGSEFADVERLEKSVYGKGKKKRTKIYYCHPYCSQERGSNENQNRMIRRKYPKGTDFGKVSAKEIKEHEAWMNNYPRRVLGWKTAESLFNESVAALE